MGFLDSIRAKLNKDKVSDLAREHGDKIDQGLDKAAKMADDKTKGKYSDKIQQGADKAKDTLGKLSGSNGKDGGTPPSPPAAS
ncbi:antitoxin [Streptomyces sp. VRA16 Mangrove soil]|uniref:antitoxin n=1 Tax=Streptomyces sp. VRA16 Mangrove soil TaxID=2817434 RepID=UPI001A9F9C51|nr:antitoxin [Streptomyces sp. VRA16 Mangrove soil]MBO1335815.1 antitoxin [Streptomyces sp. VRA16 Mangrove soil]